jgi:hypothetical protein
MLLKCQKFTNIFSQMWWYSNYESIKSEAPPNHIVGNCDKNFVVLKKMKFTTKYSLNFIFFGNLMVKFFHQK